MDKRKLRDLGIELWRNFELNSTMNDMIANKDIYTNQIEYFAELRGIKFKALLKQGFSRQEALYLLEKTQLFG